MGLESTIGEKLSDLRNDRKMTLNDVAKRSKLSVSTISGYENGKNPPTHESLVKLLAVYGVTIDEFYGIK